MWKEQLTQDHTLIINVTETTSPNKIEITIMSRNTSNNMPIDMDNDEDRFKTLSDAMDSDPSDATGADDTQFVTPNQNKTKAPGKNMASRFKRNATPSGSVLSSQSASQTPPQNKPQTVDAAPKTVQHGKANVPVSTKSITVEGTNIGSRASEPDWSTEELQQIANVCSKRLGQTMMSETRRSVPDPANKYLMIAGDGSVVTKGAATLPNIGWDEFKLGLGKVKPDEKTGKAKLYSDVVMRGPNWVLSQWTSKNVVLEGVADNILDKPPRVTNGKPDRRIGHDFARIGLPKTSFGPIFETLKVTFPMILDDVSTTKGYYWLNASWGVTGSPGRFLYTGKDKVTSSTFRLYDAMKMVAGYSSMGAGAIAISIANESEMRGGKMHANTTKYELSIKIHNMFHMKKVNYHSPPQAASTGFEVTDDMLDETESLEPVSNVGAMMSDTAGAFSTSSANPFFGSIASVTSSALPGQNNERLLI